MLDDRFAPDAFAAEATAAERAEELQAEVTRLLAPAIEAAMRDVVGQLNALGHRLVDEQLEAPEETCYETAEGHAPYLYLCHDSIVSAGVRHLLRDENAKPP
jgi:hypothetical protein